jgi:hypothetical protein
LPLTRTQDDGDDLGLAGSAARKRLSHLFLITIFRSQKRGANQQNDHARCSQLLLDFMIQVIPRVQHSVVPNADEAFAMKRREVL